MNNITDNAFRHKNGAARYTHIKVGRNKSCFSSDPLDGDNKYTASDICKMIEVLVDNMHVRFGEQLFLQTIGIPMEKTMPQGKRDLAREFYLLYCYIDDLHWKKVKVSTI